MTSLGDRLRGLTIPGRRPSTHDEAPPARDVRPDVRAAADLLGGRTCTSHGHEFVIVDRKYAGGHRHGHASVLDALPPDCGVWPRLPLLVGGRQKRPLSPVGRLMFFDLETTGLAGGAGTYAFLVGFGWFEGAAFRTRQFLLSSFAAERDILQAVAELVGDSAGLVTFNGKSFDVPLIDTRFAIHRLEASFAELPHVDMLHVARRFWKQPDSADADGTSGAGCRLTDLEQGVCGHEREGDVPGFEIPARYFHFVRSGDARPLEAVLEHNRLDLLSLALLTGRIAQLLDDGPQFAGMPREALGLAFVYERAGLTHEALDAYAHAAGLPADAPRASRFGPKSVDPVTRAEALRGYAALCRRERRFEDAALAWQCVLEIRDCPLAIAREAAEALAVHHEHRARDLDRARRFAVQSLQYRSTHHRTQAVQHRLARLDRKLERRETVGLF